MKKALIPLGFLGLFLSAYLFFDNQEKQAEIISLQQQRNELADSLFRANLVSRIYSASIGGIYGGLTLQDVELGNKVVDFITQSEPVPEQAYLACWDRLIKTSKWKVMAGYTVMEDCIYTVRDDKVAVMLLELSAMKQQAQARCEAKGSSAYGAALSCWADSSSRFLDGLDAVFFNSIAGIEDEDFDPLYFFIGSH